MMYAAVQIWSMHEAVSDKGSCAGNKTFKLDT